MRAGRYTVAAWAAGFREASHEGNLDLAPGEQRRDLVLVLQPAGAIAGQVRDEAGAPVAGATVRVDHRGAFGGPSATTGPDGRYTVDAVRPGPNRVRVSHPEFRSPPPRLVQLPAAGGGAGDGPRADGVDFVLRAGGAIAGLVVTAEGAPADTAVVLHDRRGRRLRSERARGGRFRFAGLRGGSYLVRAGPLDGAVGVERVGVPARGEIALVLVLEAGGVLAGRVEDPQGAPLAGVRVRAARRGLAFGVERRTDAAGRFRLEGLPDGSYVVRAIPEGMLSEPPPLVLEVIGGHGPPDVVLRLEPGAVLVGRVVAADGGPAGGAMVSVYDAEHRHANTVTAAPDGSFRVDRLPAGILHVFARLGTELARERFGVRAGEELAVAIHTHRMGEIEGRVLGADGQPLARALVDCRSTDGIVVRRVRSDGKGRYRVQHLYPGTYRLVVSQQQHRAELYRTVGPAAAIRGVDLLVR